jgi:Uma2 family endonuclease
MAAPHVGTVTPEEYLRAERLADRKHELVNGVVYAMSGASFAHVEIVSNLHHHLRNLLSRPCRVLMSDMRVAVEQTSLYTYPDLSVVCEKPVFRDSQFDTLTNPLVLIEVLSPSTEAYDRGAKFLHYRTISSLQAYILVAQNLALVECFVKNEAGDWILHAALGRDQEMFVAPLGVTISLAAVYENIDVPDTLSERMLTPDP